MTKPEPDDQENPGTATENIVPGPSEERRLVWIVLGVALAGTTGGNLVAPMIKPPPAPPASNTTISLPPGSTAQQALVAVSPQLTPARIRELRAVVAEENREALVRMQWALWHSNPTGPEKARISAIEEWIRIQDPTYRPPTYDWQDPPPNRVDPTDP